MTSQTMPESADPIGAPRDREVALSCAYIRLLGSSQLEAAKTAGVDPRTLGRWESCSWWPDVQREAADRWLAGAIGKARKALLAALDQPDGPLALKVLERVVPELAPARHAVELKGSLANIDIDTLPHDLLARIAAGEHPLQVLAEAAAEYRPPPAKLIAPPVGDGGEG